MSPTAGSLRGVGCGRLLLGAGTLVALHRDAIPVLDGLPRARAAARLLALRDVAQGATLVVAPEQHLDQVALGGVTVDSLHAASMLALIGTSRRYRKAAALSAATALVWILATSAARLPQSRLLRPSRIQR